jgi:hypothetical protein
MKVLIYLTLGSFVVLILSVYVFLIGKADGKYYCFAYTYLDYGKTDSFLVFKDNKILHLESTDRITYKEADVGSYYKTSYSDVTVVDKTLGHQYSLEIGVWGLYMSDKDAAKYNIQLPRFANLWCRRSFW